MTIKNRKQAFASITKEAKEKALIAKVAQEVQQTSSSPQEYAKNFLKRILEETDVHIIGEDDVT